MNEPIRATEMLAIVALLVAFALSLVLGKVWGEKDSSDEEKEG